ncbi:UDP-N-acetylmuramate dehydrogenase [Caproiciproducens faecalis]|uniref:UDP-N-acetylenolpyruvoylglucosamine reductase n=1 Tax=Caproiciproducens faecalis TaxID=2820301 RepID=A0ABS7DRH0_9FIRM|nr:UDP-N-acetylmuramate dehydrogenase [Caproiciproducens faecalis]MBW7573617.1 UDP-N-acetylmuramate dehydrogenase [Caproiciproducens faecalis]
MNHLEQLALEAENLGCKVSRNEPMSRHTTFKIGGPADLFITVYTRAELQKLYHAANELNVPLMPIGNGSNMLVSDNGIRGAVIALDGEFREIKQNADGTVSCGAGASLAGACVFAREHSLTGLEFAWGIPGAAGGAAFMNAGAYNKEMKSVLVACTHVTKDGQIGTLSGEALQLGYRHSAYTDNGCTILSLRLGLKPGDKDEIAAEMDDLYSRRKSKQPLELPSAGSVFKRPEGHFAGSLIEGCGLKGRAVGGAMVSPKHAGFIVNTGGATCRDVTELIKIIQDTVYQQTNVMLECEVKTIGC